MTGFTLFRLPLLPLKSALDMMCFGGLLSLQLCSAKTRVLCKLIKKSISIKFLSNDQRRALTAMEKFFVSCFEVQNNPFGPFLNIFITVEVDAGSGIKIRVNNDRFEDFFPLVFNVECIQRQEEYAGNSGNLDIGGFSVPITMQYKSLYTFWTNQSDGLKTLVNYFKGLFNSQSIRYSIYGSWDWKFSQNLRTAVEGMTHQTIERCRIDGNHINDYDYTFILDKINPTVRFEQSSSAQNRSDEFRHKKSFKVEYLKLIPSNWFTFGNLITTDCENIELSQSRLTIDDICKYIELWMDGKYPKLKSLDVELGKHINTEYIVSKLRSFSKMYTVDRVFHIVLIKRNGKIVASASSSGKTIHFNIT